MRLYVIVLLQIIIWSIYSFVKWLSKSDGIIPKAFLLLICSYFAVLIANRIGFTRKKSIIITCFTLFIFFSFERLFWSLT